MAAVSLAVLVASYRRWWPIGLANNGVFFILFLRGRLYADMGLQVVYFVLGLYGWWNWVKGGQGRTELRISSTRAWEWLMLAAAEPLATWGMREVLVRVNDASPGLDAMTTVLSLAAQYLLCRKRFENWYFWIAADMIYIPLYFSRQLPLTGILYIVFLLMCLAGLVAFAFTERSLPRMKFGLGLVIGKFYPPHRGHKLLIDTAIEQSAHTVVIVCAKPVDTIPGELRARWLREIHPAAEVCVIDDRYDENDSRVWAENTIGWLGRAPDAVFTSEDYGDRYARLMGARHVMVDRARVRLPICATRVRQDPYANWEFLVPCVRAWFVKRVCVLGAESTGTTTLAQALAETLETVWVPEYGREYSERKMARKDAVWQTGEFVHLAEEQNRRDEQAARAANRVLIGDTNAFATRLWHYRYMGTHSAEVAAIASLSRCDLYLLTGDEIPFVQDGLRDGEPIRQAMHGWFEQALAGQNVPWHVVRGSRSERLQTALASIAGLFHGSAWRPKW